MTMVTLIGKPVNSTSRPTSRTSPIPCHPLQEPTASILNTCYHDTHTFKPPAGLRDIPTNVPMTTAAPADDDDDRSLRCHPSAILDNDNPTLPPIDPQEWEILYNDFIQFANSFNTANITTNDETTTPTAANPAGVNTDRPLADGSTTNTTNQPLKDTSPNAKTPSDKSSNGPPHLSNDYSTELADDNERHPISADKATTTYAHLATPSQTAPDHDNKLFDYKAQLHELDNEINRMMQLWPMTRPTAPTSLQHMSCPQNTTTCFQTPDDTSLPTVAIESLSTAAHPAITPIVQQRVAITTEFPCLHPTFLTNECTQTPPP